MKTTFIISLAIGLSVLAFGGKSIEEAKVPTILPRFYGMVVSSNANVIVSMDSRHSIRVEGAKEYVNEISVIAENGTLVISGETEVPVTIYISVEEINFIEINGAAKLISDGTLNSDILFLKINGEGSMKLDVRTLSLAMTVRENGKITISGSTGESRERISGNGKIHSSQLDAFNRTEERIAFYEKNISVKNN